MAPESKTNKRKASVPASEAAVKKVKKTSTDTEGAKKRKAAAEITTKPAKKSKAAASSTAPKTKSTSEKKKKSTDTVVKKSTPRKNITKSILSTNRVSVSDDESDEVEEEAAENSEDEEELDDQTAALLAGFDSEDEDSEPTGEGFKEGGDVGKLDKKVRKQALAAQKKATDSDEPGVVYLGHIPHGFYEHEIRSYFSQFGEITRLRVSRNPRTGRSKHFAFLEFKSSEVAEIVAKTMDNYYLFQRNLKCKLVAPGQLHENVWKGANKRFKAVPWNKIAGRKLKQGLDEAQWEKRIENEEERRAEKAEKLKAIGYEFEAPKLKSAKEVPKTKRVDKNAALEAEAELGAIEAASDAEADEEIKAIEPAPVAGAKKNDKKSKKGQETVSQVTETVESSKIEVVEEAPEAESSKGKKKSKKVEKVTMTEVEVTEEPTAEKPSTSLKSKKSKDKLTTKEAKAEKPVPALKSKKSKENVAEAGKGKKLKKQKSSSSLA